MKSYFRPLTADKIRWYPIDNHDAVNQAALGPITAPIISGWDRSTKGVPVITGRATIFPISGVIFTFWNRYAEMEAPTSRPSSPTVPYIDYTGCRFTSTQRPTRGQFFDVWPYMARTPTAKKRCATSRPLRVMHSMSQCPLSGLQRANWHFSSRLRCHHEKAIKKYTVP